MKKRGLWCPGAAISFPAVTFLTGCLQDTRAQPGPRALHHGRRLVHRTVAMLRSLGSSCLSHFSKPWTKQWLRQRVIMRFPHHKPFNQAVRGIKFMQESHRRCGRCSLVWFLLRGLSWLSLFCKQSRQPLMATVASWSTPVLCEILAPAYIYQSNIRGVSPSICLHEAWKCIPLMCDHYTNEVNGSAVLTIRWMPPSGTVPLYGCVLLLCTPSKPFFFFFWCVYSPQHLKHKKVLWAWSDSCISPLVHPSQLKPLHQPEVCVEELSLNFTNGWNELMTSSRLLREGKLLAFLGEFFFLFFC